MDAVRTDKWIGRLYADTPCVVAARRVLRRRLAAVDGLIKPAARTSHENPELIHQLRVAARRSLAALRAFRGYCRGKPFRSVRKRLQRVRREAEAARQLDVYRAMLKQAFEQAPESQPGAHAWLQHQLAEQRTAGQRAVENLAASHQRLAGRRLRQLLGPRKRANRASGAPYALTALAAERLAALLRGVQEKRSRDLTGPPALHDLRIAAKKLRYALEIFAGCYPARLKSDLYGRVERMIDHLGELNDLFEIAAHVEHAAQTPKRASAGSTNGNGRADEPGLAEIARSFRERYRHRHREFLTWWESPASFELFESLEELIHTHGAASRAALRDHLEPALRVEPAQDAALPSVPATPRAGSLVHRRVAAIDVGSNSIRLVVGETDPLTKFRVIEDMKESTRLGSGVFTGGSLTEEAMEASIRAIERMKEVATGCRVDRIRAIGTSAIREAANRTEFSERVQRRTGIHLEIIDPRHEARLAYSSVANTFELDDRRVAIADIGGGSTELVLSSGGVIDHVHPLPLGAVRLTERFGGRESRERFDDIRRAIDTVLHNRLGSVRYQPYLIIGTGGTFTSLARVAIRHGTSSVGGGRFPFAVRGYELRHGEVMYFLELLRRMPLEERRKVPGLSSQRAEIIVAGVCIIERLMQHFGVDRMRVHDGGIRDGLLAEMIDDLGFRAEPPRRHPPTSLKAVRRFAERSRYDKPHSEHVARLATRIFDQLIEHNPDAIGTWGHAEARHLLQAAAILHDVGMAIAYSRHHKHSYDMVVHADLPSYTRREVEIIANICRYHRRRGPGSGQATFRRLGDDDQRLVTHLVGILRIADGLDRTHQQDVADVGVTATVRRTIFDVAAKAQPAANMLAARRKADVFERAFRTRVRLVWTAAQDAASEPAIIEEEVAEIA